MRDFLNITKALADESRVRLLLSLQKCELCVCQLTALIGSAPATVPKHLSILNQARLVNSRKDGRWIYYSLPSQASPVVVREAMDWIEKSLEADSHAVQDRKRLQKILKQDPAELCKRQCRK
jgi:ArsR family transcriptional regulator, arsenate/arsenite/antimonite-responsive transcriptional repressor